MAFGLVTPRHDSGSIVTVVVKGQGVRHMSNEHARHAQRHGVYGRDVLFPGLGQIILFLPLTDYCPRNVHLRAGIMFRF